MVEGNLAATPISPRDPLATRESELTTTNLLLRRSAAVGEYVLGGLDLATAARTAQLSEQHLRQAVLDRACERAGDETPTLSVVVPVFNNEGTLHRMHAEVVAAVDCSLELVFVDDGSMDGSVDVLRELRAADDRVRVLLLSRNFGQQAALSAGLAAATGSAVVMMDADLQDPPTVLPDMLAKWRAGHEVVHAMREHRKENRVRRLCYAGFYRLYRYLAETDVPLDSGDFCLLDRRVVEVIREMPERTRFLRGMRSWTGFRQTVLRYDRGERGAGDSQYTLRRMIRLAADGLVSFSNVPLRLSALLGIIASVAGLALLLFVVGVAIVDASLPTGWASSLSVPLLVGGTQLCMLGVLGAYVARIYAEVKKRPVYIVRERWE